MSNEELLEALKGVLAPKKETKNIVVPYGSSILFRSKRNKDTCENNKTPLEGDYVITITEEEGKEELITKRI